MRQGNTASTAMSTTIEPTTGTSETTWLGHDATIGLYPQKESLIFRVPPEIRRLIFSFALAEIQVSDGRYVARIGEPDLEDVPLAYTTNVRGHYALYDRDVPVWLRPGSTSRMTIPLDLICTCKRIYNETHRLLHRIKKHKFYVLHGPDQVRTGKLFGLPYTDFTSPSGAHVVNLHIFTQSEFLDAERVESLQSMQFASVTQTLENLSITVRPLCNTQRAQQKITYSQALVVNPYVVRSTLSDMQKTQDAMFSGDDFEVARDGWSAVFFRLPKLKTFTMEFEHHEGQHENLEKLARWAQVWKFPMPGELSLVSESPAVRSSWRGLRVHDNLTCVLCGKISTDPRPQCERCKWRGKGKGPRMITWTVNWIARKNNR